MEFWNELLTKASWEKLHVFSREFNFVLIGGWAAYLWTGQHKSKDIDIVVDYETLAKLQAAYKLEKNERLKKYEIKFDKFDIDIYVPYFSKLSLPLEDIVKVYTAKIESIQTVEAEVLLILKQGAEIERRNSVKGVKDSIDIVTLLYYAPLNLKKYHELLRKYKLDGYHMELLHIVNTFQDENIKYLGLDFQQFKKWKKKIVEEIRKL